MTVTTTASTTGPMAGNGSNASWPFTFPVQDATQLRVIWRHSGIETVLTSSEYSVALVNSGRSGGTVTYPLGSSRVAVGESVTIRRSLTITQPTNLRNQGSLAPETLETSSDRTTFQIQWVRDEVDRALQIAESDTGTLLLPSATDRASKYLAFDSSGEPVASAATSGTVPVTAWSTTLLDDTSAIVARATLGLPASAADYGVVGDGTTNDTSAIAAMATALGYVRLTRGAYRVATATLDAPIHFEPGAYLTVDAAATYTITGRIDSPRQWIFRGSGLVALASDANTGEDSRMAHVSWFGAFPSSDPGSDQAPLVQKAITAMGNTRESEILFDIGNYHIFTAMTVTRGCHIKGAGTRRTVFRLNANTFDVFTTTEVAAKFSDIQFEVQASALAYRSAGAYIRISHGECEIYDCTFYNGAGIVVTGNNCRIDNISAAFGTDLGAGSSLIRIASGSGSRVSNVMAGTSDNGPEALVRLGGTGGGALSGAVIENVQHICPSASVHIEAFAGNVSRCAISGCVYNGSAGTAPTYAVKLATSSTFSLTDVALSNIVIASYATNGVQLQQDSSGTMEDITLDGVDVTGSSGIGLLLARTAGTLRDVQIGDTVNLLERATPISYSGTSSNIRVAAMATPNAGPAICYTSTVADDAVLTINLQRSVFSGVGILSCGSTHYGMFVVRAASTPAVTAMITSSASVASTTGVLAGTTGTDTKLTLSADVGVIYIENRLGSSQAVNFTLLTGD